MREWLWWTALAFALLLLNIMTPLQLQLSPATYTPATYTHTSSQRYDTIARAYAPPKDEVPRDEGEQPDDEHRAPEPDPSSYATTNTMVRCALVSTSGELLASEQGHLIDTVPIVARIGQGPVTPELAKYVGSRSSVRIIAMAFLNSKRRGFVLQLEQMHRSLSELDAEGREVLWVGNGKDDLQVTGCTRPVRDFMRSHPGLPFHCVSAKFGVTRRANACFGATHERTPRLLSTGALAVSFLFERYGCNSLMLFGFGESGNLSLPYHYWHDRSVHDGETSAEWYAKRAKMVIGRGANKMYGHDFVREHRVMYSMLGRCSWSLRREAYVQECVAASHADHATRMASAERACKRGRIPTLQDSDESSANPTKE